MAMGNVVQFELKSGKSEDPPRHATDIASMSWELARHLQTIEVCCRSFEKDMKTIESIACSTKDPELRKRLLGEFESLQNQLAAALTMASSAKGSVRETRNEAMIHVAGFDHR